jgi:hypothetical protein
VQHEQQGEQGGEVGNSHGMFAKEPRLKAHCDGLLLVAYSELWSLLREVSINAQISGFSV